MVQTLQPTQVASLTTFAPVAFVNRDGFYRASVQAPSLVALGAGVRYFFTCFVEVEDLDARFGCGKCAIVFKSTSHFALQTAGALVCVNVQHFLHVSPPSLLNKSS